MSQARVELVKRGMDAYSRGDVEGLLPLLDPDIEWHPAFQVLLGGSTETYRGHEGVRQLFRETEEALSGLTAEAADVRDLGDRVVVTGRLRLRGRTSGAEIESPLGLVVEFNADKICAVTSYLDPDEAFSAAGLTE